MKHYAGLMIVAGLAAAAAEAQTLSPAYTVALHRRQVALNEQAKWLARADAVWTTYQNCLESNSRKGLSPQTCEKFRIESETCRLKASAVQIPAEPNPANPSEGLLPPGSYLNGPHNPAGWQSQAPPVQRFDQFQGNRPPVQRFDEFQGYQAPPPPRFDEFQGYQPSYPQQSYGQGVQQSPQYRTQPYPQQQQVAPRYRVQYLDRMGNRVVR